jgi:hypothetical protein
VRTMLLKPQLAVGPQRIRRTREGVGY